MRPRLLWDELYRLPVRRNDQHPQEARYGIRNASPREVLGTPYIAFSHRFRHHDEGLLIGEEITSASNGEYGPDNHGMYTEIVVQRNHNGSHERSSGKSPAYIDEANEPVQQDEHKQECQRATREGGHYRIHKAGYPFCNTGLHGNAR